MILIINLGSRLNVVVGICRKRQINKPRPITDDDMEEIFQEVKEKQEAADKAFEQEHEGGHELEVMDKRLLSLSDQKLVAAKTKGRSRRPSGILLGSTVRIVSGTFTDFTGTVKKLDKKRGMVWIPFLPLFLYLLKICVHLNLKE